MHLIGFRLVALLLQVDPWVTSPGHFKDVVAPADPWVTKKVSTKPQQMAKPEIPARRLERFQRFVDGHHLVSFSMVHGTTGDTMCQSMWHGEIPGEQRDRLDLLIVRQHERFNALEALMEQQTVINAGAQTTLARIETLLARLIPPGENGRDA